MRDISLFLVQRFHSYRTALLLWLCGALRLRARVVVHAVCGPCSSEEPLRMQVHDFGCFGCRGGGSMAANHLVSHTGVVLRRVDSLCCVVCSMIRVAW